MGVLQPSCPLPPIHPPPGTSSMPCAGRSKSWWKKSWTSTACWSLGPCPGSSEGPPWHTHSWAGLGPCPAGSAHPEPQAPAQASLCPRILTSTGPSAPSSSLALSTLLCPLAPRKGSWLADKVKRLMRPRREGGPHGGPRPWADGAGSTESLGAPSEAELSVGREADGTGGSGAQPPPILSSTPQVCPLGCATLCVPPNALPSSLQLSPPPFCSPHAYSGS